MEPLKRIRFLQTVGNEQLPSTERLVEIVERDQEGNTRYSTGKLTVEQILKEGFTIQWNTEMFNLIPSQTSPAIMVSPTEPATEPTHTSDDEVMVGEVMPESEEPWPPCQQGI